MHVLVVHFPIALLLVGGALELWNRRNFAAQRAALARSCISLGAVSAIVAAVLGWIHADHARLGSSAAETLALHRWSGIATALVALAAVMLGRGTQADDKPRPWHLASVVLVMVLVAATGHFGGELVYGEGFFFEGLIGQKTSKAAEAPSDPLTISQTPAADAQPATQAPNSGLDYATQIRPILEASCYECHGERKQKGRLRLDRIETALKQNEDGDWIIKPGDPAASELMRRVTLPEDDDDHMPAKDESLTKEQIELLKRWIELGAPIGSAASAGSQAHATATAAQSAAPTPPARDEVAYALDELRSSGAIAQKVAQDSELLDVDFHLRGASVGDEQLAALGPLAPKLVQLNLAHTAVTDDGLAHVAKLTALEQLNLSGTALGDAGVAHLAPLAKLEVLNLYATNVTDRALAQIAALPSLKRVYLWQTQVSDAGAAALATLRPDVTVVRAQ
jgi:uncharacterized membrane protein/mono/diheme cytochrome c family protein